jgi:hypothetical protein
VFLAALLFLAALFWRVRSVPKLVTLAPRAATPRFSEAKTARKVYPFSVIYGGAYSAQELVRARKVDAVAARHYAGFGSSPTVQRLPKDTFMFVSYRKSNHVFWTRTRHRIPRGETVLFDGQNLARTRCGNRLSPKPQAPVAPGKDPTEEALDIPDGPKAPLLAASPRPSTPDADFFVPPSPADLSSMLTPFGPVSPTAFQSGASTGDWGRPYGFGRSPGGAGPFLGNSLFYPDGAGISGTGANSATAITDYGPGNAMIIPEPSTIPLLLLGLLLGSPALVRRWRTAPVNNRQK